MDDGSEPVCVTIAQDFANHLLADGRLTGRFAIIANFAANSIYSI
jgi:hypothetical protein